jgi:uncharacterized membrane protein YkoI
MSNLRKIALALGATGLLGTTFLASTAGAGSDMKLEELPASVQATVKREVKSGTITDVEKDTEHGAVIYEIEFDLNGKSWEIDVAPDGKLLQRHED